MFTVICYPRLLYRFGFDCKVSGICCSWLYGAILEARIFRATSLFLWILFLLTFEVCGKIVVVEVFGCFKEMVYVVVV